MMMNLSDAKYEPAAIVARQNSTVAVTISMTLIGALAVALRIFTRSHIVGTIWADDWAMVSALFFAFGYATELLIAVKVFNAGESGATLSSADKIALIKITTAIIVTYKLVLTLTKVSILCFYLRIAVRPLFEKVCKATLIIIVLFQVAVTFVAIGQCVPIRKMYDLTGKVPGKCINVNFFVQFVSCFHIFTDIFIFILPIQVIRAIARPMKEKIGLCIIFGLGFFSILAAVFRLTFLHRYTVSKDPFFEFIPINIWSMVEINVGILCASLPTLRPLFSKTQRHRTREVWGFTSPSKDKSGAANNDTKMTSGSIAIALGTTVRGSFVPTVPPKGPLSTVPEARGSEQSFETDLENSRYPKKLALLRRDQNGIFRPEAVYQ